MNHSNAGGAGAGELIRRCRVAAGLTQEELSDRADISVRTVRNLEHGRVRRPRRSTVELLAAALGLDHGATARLARLARPPAAPCPPRAGPAVIVVARPAGGAGLTGRPGPAGRPAAPGLVVVAVVVCPAGGPAECWRALVGARRATRWRAG